MIGKTQGALIKSIRWLSHQPPCKVNAYIRFTLPDTQIQTKFLNVTKADSLHDMCLAHMLSEKPIGLSLPERHHSCVDSRQEMRK